VLWALLAVESITRLENKIMKKIKLNLLLALMTLVFMGSCSTRLVDFTVISSKNHSLQIDKSVGVPVKGTSMGFLGLGVSIKDAMDKALQDAGPEYDLLIDGVVRFVNYPLISGYSVEGMAVNSAKLKKQMGEKGFNEWIEGENIFVPKD
jgi:hypothetical protein